MKANQVIFGMILFVCVFDIGVSLSAMACSGDLKIDKTILRGGSSSIVSFAISSDRKQVVFADKVGIVKLWDLHTNKCIRTFDCGSYICALVFDSADKILAFGGIFGKIHVWKLDVRSDQKKIYRIECDGRAKVFTADSCCRFVAFDDHFGGVRLWNLKTNKLDAQFHCGGNIYSLIFNKTGSVLAVSTDDGKIMLWSIETKKCISEFYANGLAYTIAMSTDDNFLALSDGCGKTELWDLKTNKCKNLFDGKNYADALAFSPDSSFLACADGFDIKLWNIKTNECVHVFEGESCVKTLMFSPDGFKIIAGLENGNVVIYTDLFAKNKGKVEAFALAQAMLARPGANSPAQSLTADVVQHIYETLGVRPWEDVFAQYRTKKLRSNLK